MGRGRRCGLGHGGQQLTAGLFTTAAGFLAHPAVRVHLGMPLALISATLADRHTGLNQRPADIGVVFGRAADNPERSCAEVGAVNAQPDAFDHVGKVALAQVSVNVGGAGLGAVAEGIDCGGQYSGVDTRVMGVGVKHLSGVAHGFLRCSKLNAGLHLVSSYFNWVEGGLPAPRLIAHRVADSNGRPAPSTARACYADSLRINGVTSDAPPVTGLALQFKDLLVTYGTKQTANGVSLDINEIC